MSGSLKRLAPGTQKYASGLEAVQVILRRRDAEGVAHWRELAGNPEDNEWKALMEREDWADIVGAIQQHGADFRRYPPLGLGLPPADGEVGWQPRWEEERDGRQPQVSNGGKGAVERE